MIISVYSSIRTSVDNAVFNLKITVSSCICHIAVGFFVKIKMSNLHTACINTVEVQDMTNM